MVMELRDHEQRSLRDKRRNLRSPIDHDAGEPEDFKRSNMSTRTIMDSTSTGTGSAAGSSSIKRSSDHSNKTSRSISPSSSNGGNNLKSLISKAQETLSPVGRFIRDPFRTKTQDRHNQGSSRGMPMRIDLPEPTTTRTHAYAIRHTRVQSQNQTASSRPAANSNPSPNFLLPSSLRDQRQSQSQQIPHAHSTTVNKRRVSSITGQYSSDEDQKNMNKKQVVGEDSRAMTVETNAGTVGNTSCAVEVPATEGTEVKRQHIRYQSRSISHDHDSNLRIDLDPFDRVLRFSTSTAATPESLPGKTLSRPVEPQDEAGQTSWQVNTKREELEREISQKAKLIDSLERDKQHLEQSKKKWLSERVGLQTLIEEQKATISTLQESLEIALSEKQHVSDREQLLNARLKKLQQEYQRSVDDWKSKVHNLERDKLDYQTQIEKMARIVSQLNKRGLPLPHDDAYFKRELDGLVHDIRQFARLFTRRQKPLSLELISTFHFSDPVKQCLQRGFSDLQSLVTSEEVGGRIRTRCVEVIMFWELMNDLSSRPIGFHQDYYHQVHMNFGSNMLCSAEETHVWKALTVHLLTKNNPTFKQRQEEEINSLTDKVYENIAQWGEFKLASKDGLRSIVTKVAELGLELAQLPFRIVPLDLKPGVPFDDHRMEDVEGERDEDEDDVPRKTTIILSYPWAKVTFDEDGKAVFNSRNILCKAQVSCLQ